MKKLWGIRHVRYFVLRAKFNWWWLTCGQFFGAFPNEADLDYLEAVWAGER